MALSEIADAIHRVVSETTLSVVDEFTGHGIGTDFHMLPYIVHTPNRFAGVMQEGHTFTIEPVVVEVSLLFRLWCHVCQPRVAQGSTKFSIWPDRWTAVSRDLGRGAQVEHTVLITGNGCEILTRV